MTVPTAAAWRWRWSYWTCAALFALFAVAAALTGDWFCAVVVAGYSVVAFRRPKDMRVTVEYGYWAGRADRTD